MEALDVKEFRRLDLNSEEMGVPVKQLMANAGAALAGEASRMAPEGRILFLCGKGNNGGDGYAACSILQREGRDAKCVAVEPPAGSESKAYHDECIKVLAWPDVGDVEPTMVVDCLLGSGVEGAPRPPYDAALDWMREQNAILACDVPSAYAVTPQATVTFHAAKTGMTPENSGNIIVADIGIPEEAATMVGIGDLAVAHRKSSATSHKGDNGRVVIVGGGPFTGAPYYAAIGALRTGCDLALIYAPRGAAEHIRNYGPEPVVHDAGQGGYLDEAGVQAVVGSLAKADALVMGPGLGNHPKTMEAAGKILAVAAAAKLPVVIDADGLDAIDDEYLRQNGDRTVLTPHGKEFQDLTESSDSDQEAVTEYANRHGVTVLRKGAIDVISTPGRSKQCSRGNPIMTVGGTGDVLAGCVGALMARGAEPFDAACAGAYLMGVAGELTAEKMPTGATAVDIAARLPDVLARLG